MWKKISCSLSELNLDITLGGGQAFRWIKTDNKEWHGVVSNLVYKLKQDVHGNILYLCTKADENINTTENVPLKKRKKVKKESSNDIQVDNTSNKNLEETLKHYLNLDFNLEHYYNLWNKCDDNFLSISNNYKGIRILCQDPVENLFSFICSANNNIPRITSMVEKLSIHYGNKITEIEGHTFYTFPTINRLAEEGVEGKLRALGFGYRAKYIHQTAKMLHMERPNNWLYSLKNLPYKEAHSALMALSGVGAKVADCVCLMSLDKYDAIPVDTHIWQVTMRHYMPQLKSGKTLTDKVYQEIGNFYRQRFGEYAGWANTILFAADLKMFKNEKKL